MRIVEEQDIFAHDNTDEHLRFVQTEQGVSIHPTPNEAISPSEIFIYTPGKHSHGLSFDLDLCEFKIHLCFSWDTLQELFNVAQDRIKTQSK